MRVEVKVEGRVITARFGILAIRKYAEANDLSLSQVGTDIQEKSILAIADLFYYAYLSDCELSDKVPEGELSKAAFTNMLEILTEAQLKEISEAIADIKLFGKSISELNDTKKKVTKKK